MSLSGGSSSPVGWDFHGQPEKWGLTEVAEIDAGGSFEFDLVTIWRDQDGKLWMGEDSGCSCPVPYEDHVWPTDFEEVASIDQVETAVRKRWRHYGPSAGEVLDFIRTVKEALDVGKR